MGEYGREQKNQLSRAIANSKTKGMQLQRFVDNRLISTAQMMTNAISNVNQFVKVSADIKLKYKEKGVPIEKTKTGNSGSPGIAQDNIKRHPQTKKMLGNYAIGANPSNPLYSCAEPRVLGSVIADLHPQAGKPAPEIETISIESKVKKIDEIDLGKAEFQEGGHYYGAKNVGDQIRRCNTCISLLGDANPDVLNDYSPSADQKWE